MKNRMLRTLFERFGDPIDAAFGTKIGDEPSITKVGAVGVRDMRNEDAVVCPQCGMMPINGKCDCENSEVCPRCGMMPPALDKPCQCGSLQLSEGECTDGAVNPGLPDPGEIAKDTLSMLSTENDELDEVCVDEPSGIKTPSIGDIAAALGISENTSLFEAKDNCSQCGMYEDVCECGMNEADNTCNQCGMNEDVCQCGMNEYDMEEVAPPGHEKMVKGLKKAGNVENPWAVAWSHYKKKHRGGRGKRH